MNIHAIQPDLFWNEPAKNLDNICQMLRVNPPSAGDLVVLPEMFSTGFSVKDPQAPDGEGPWPERIENFLQDISTRYQCYALAGATSRCLGNTQNMLQNLALAYDDKGQRLCSYAKIHPFSYGGEDNFFAPGNEIQTFEWNGFNVCPVICYDLRFPELFRKGLQLGADAFVVIANWPAARQMHWETLLRARAIENQSWVLGVNRCGDDPKLHYDGGTVVYNATGEILAQLDDQQGVLRQSVDAEAQKRWREKFPVLQDIRL